MKPLIALFAFLVGGAVAAGGLALFLTSNPSVSTDTEAGEAAPDAAPEVEDLRAELARLSETVHDLQMEVAGLRSVAAREALPAVPQAEQVTPESLAAAGLTPVQIEERMRQVFAAEREREEQEAEDQRREREVQNAMRQADRIAERLSLSPADARRLGDHLVVAQDKRSELFDGARGAGWDRASMRTTMEELRDWNNAELTRLFGPDVGGQIAEQTNNFRGGFGGRGGGAGGNQAGSGGRGGGRGGGF